MILVDEKTKALEESLSQPQASVLQMTRSSLEMGEKQQRAAEEQLIYRMEKEQEVLCEKEKTFCPDAEEDVQAPSTEQAAQSECEKGSAGSGQKSRCLHQRMCLQRERSTNLEKDKSCLGCQMC